MIKVNALFITEESVKYGDIGIKEDEYWDEVYIKPSRIESICPTYSGNTNILMDSGDRWTIDVTSDEFYEFLKMNHYVD